MAHDPDDWFDEPQVDDPPRRRAHPGPSTRAAADDWIREPTPRRSVREGRPAVGRRAVLVAVIAVAVLLGVLAAVGVFSSNSRHAAPPAPSTTPHTPTTTQTTPTTTGRVVPPAPTTTLKPGGSGDQVKALQRALAYLGFSVGTVDGSYGPTTQHAVAAFQKSKGLAADGVVGPKTLQALSAALSP